MSYGALRSFLTLFRLPRNVRNPGASPWNASGRKSRLSDKRGSNERLRQQKVIKQNHVNHILVLNPIAAPLKKTVSKTLSGNIAAFVKSEKKPTERFIFSLTASSPTSHFALIRSEEHTSELQSLMRISYAVFCLKKTKKTHHTVQIH